MSTKTKCSDCGERPSTTTRENEPVCDTCAVEWDKPVEMHEPTIARVRRDVEKYKCQAAWLDTWALLRMFDQTRADLARALPVVEAAGAVVNEYERHGRCVVSMSMDTEVSTDLLDALATAIRGGEQRG